MKGTPLDGAIGKLFQVSSLSLLISLVSRLLMVVFAGQVLHGGRVHQRQIPLQQAGDFLRSGAQRQGPLLGSFALCDYVACRAARI